MMLQKVFYNLWVSFREGIINFLGIIQNFIKILKISYDMSQRNKHKHRGSRNKKKHNTRIIGGFHGSLFDYHDNNIDDFYDDDIVYSGKWPKTVKANKSVKAVKDVTITPPVRTFKMCPIEESPENKNL